MMASRGMGAVLPSKMPKAVKKTRRDDTNFTQFEEGGDVQDKEKEDEIKYNAPKKEDEIKYNVQNPRLNIAKGLKELSSRLTAEKNLGPNTSLQAYLDAKIGNRGPGVNGLGVNLTHRFAEGGKVNAAGNYTKPGLRKKIVAQVKAAATQGTGAGEWSARKAQLVAKKYKKAGGGYKD
jgi:hypothetical protein